MNAFTSNWLMLFPMAFSLYVAMRLAQGSVDDGRNSWVMTVIRSAIVLMFWFSMLALVARISWLAVPGGVLLLVFLFVLAVKRRRLERDALLFSMQTVDELGTQQRLAGYFFEQNYGYLRRKAGGIRRDLALGVPLEQSLEVRGIASGVYERLGLRLRRAFGNHDSQTQVEASQRTPQQIEFEVERLIGRLLVFAWVFFAIPLTIAFITIIVPTFKEMFEEFGLEIPPVFLSFIRMSDFLAKYGGGVVLVYLGLTVTLLFGIVCLLWLVPGMLQIAAFRWLCHDYYRTAGFVALSRVLHREPELASACRKTAQVLPVNYLSSRFESACHFLQSGVSVGDSFQKSKLITAKERMRLGNLEGRDATWAMHQMADWKIDRMLTRYSMMVQTAVVGLTIFLAFVIGWLAVAIIQALSSLITALG